MTEENLPELGNDIMVLIKKNKRMIKSSFQVLNCNDFHRLSPRHFIKEFNYSFQNLLFPLKWLIEYF